jgi:hypothetical protein
LFATVAGGLRQDYGVTVDWPRDGHFYFAQLGLTKRHLPFGNTTFYGEYGRYSDFGVGRVFVGNLNFGVTADKRWLLQDTEVERWGLGIEQEVKSHGLLLYAQFHHYEGSFVGQRCTDNVGPGCGPLDPAKKESFTASPWQAFVLGARIQF